MGSLGIKTAALAVAGNSPTSITEQWNGTSWTEVGDLNNGRPSPGASTNASYTSAVVFGEVVILHILNCGMELLGLKQLI